MTADMKMPIRITHPVIGTLIMQNVITTQSGRSLLTSDQAEVLARAWQDAPTNGDTVRHAYNNGDEMLFILHADAEITVDLWEPNANHGYYDLKDSPLDELDVSAAPDAWPILKDIISIVTDNTEPGVVWKLDKIVRELANAGLIISDTDGIREA